MSWLRFHRSVRLLPGLRLNVSRSGLGVSAGVRGARISIGPAGVRSTIGLPGSGLSVITQHATARRLRLARRADYRDQFIAMLVAMPLAPLLRYRDRFEATIAELPAEEIDPAQLADARALIGEAIAHAQPSALARVLLNVLAAILLAVAALLWLVSLIGLWLLAALITG